jgi:hypothetical protein
VDFNKIMGKSDVFYSEVNKGVKRSTVGLIKYNTKPPRTTVTAVITTVLCYTVFLFNCNSSNVLHTIAMATG